MHSFGNRSTELTGSKNPTGLAAYTNTAKRGATGVPKPWNGVIDRKTAACGLASPMLGEAGVPFWQSRRAGLIVAVEHETEEGLRLRVEHHDPVKTDRVGFARQACAHGRIDRPPVEEAA